MTPTTSRQRQDNSRQDKVDALALIVAMRIDDLLCELEVRLTRSGNKLIGACPIHGGTKHGSVNLYPDGHSVPGYWKCRSHHCETVFKTTIIGFVRGVLSHNKYGWEKKGDRMASFDETLAWLCKFVGQESLEKVEVDKAELERRRFAAQVDSVSRGRNSDKPEGVERATVKASLQIPSDFFIRRGYSAEILSTYDVGLCDKQGREMFNRVVVPCYDDSRKYMIGCTGRSIHPECKHCEAYHPPGAKCPNQDERWIYAKWKNSKNFLTSSCLYNHWFARKSIQETGVVVLVEGPADVWRLEECGIHNSVALFGCELSDEQQVILESSGAMSILLMLDNDEPGRKGCSVIENQLKRFYNIHKPSYEAKDIGEMTCGQINHHIVPIIKAVQRQGIVYSF